MEIDGQCHCGGVAYWAVIDPDQVSICHCADCQTLTGSAFRVTVLTPRENLHLLRGAPKLYVKVADNGKKRLQYFCPDCGSPLFTTGEGADANQWGIRWGGIRQRGELAPKRQIWRKSALPWIDDISGLPGRPAD
jgi:hypothetical protein